MSIQLNNKPKNFDSNKLINPDIIEELDEDDEDDENIDNENDEIDEETRQMLYKLSMKQPKSLFNIQNIEKTPKIEHTKKVHKSKSMSLQDFIKNTQSSTNPEITKFTSTRVESKKKQNDNTFISKRQFNPRKPPYNFTRKTNNESIQNFINSNEFPELK